RIAEELAQVATQRWSRRFVGGAQLQEQDGGRNAHAVIVGNDERRTMNDESDMHRSSFVVHRSYFFLHSGPSLASCFSVIWAPPASLRAAERSAFFWVQSAHWAGTLASAKMASTGHSGTQASQSMQSTGSIQSIMSS